MVTVILKSNYCLQNGAADYSVAGYLFLNMKNRFDIFLAKDVCKTLNIRHLNVLKAFPGILFEMNVFRASWCIGRKKAWK